MTRDFYKKLQRAKRGFYNLKYKFIRVWNLAKRLDPRSIRSERKKKSKH